MMILHFDIKYFSCRGWLNPVLGISLQHLSVHTNI